MNFERNGKKKNRKRDKDSTFEGEWRGVIRGTILETPSVIILSLSCISSARLSVEN